MTMRLVLRAPCFILAAVLAAPVLVGRTTVATTAIVSKPTRRWVEIEALAAARPDAAVGGSRRQVREWRDRQALELHKELRAYFAAHTGDGQRWEAVLVMTRFTPSFITRYGPQYERDRSDCTVDAKARAAFHADVDRYKAMLEQAPDVPPRIREDYAAGELMTAIDAPERDWAVLQRRLRAFAQDFPQSVQIQSLFDAYIYALENAAPEAVPAVWAECLDFPFGPIAQRAREKCRAYELLKHPLEIAFTAADGRSVDLARLRGKVVLVDFWATWCGPCVAEIPNVRRVYQRYHARGFEVVGVTLENARVLPGDGAEERARKREGAKAKMLRFAAEHDMPWPQYFDGALWANEIGRRYAVTAIPAMFLLDRGGRVVTTNAHGDALEQEVGRLLESE